MFFERILRPNDVNERTKIKDFLSDLGLKIPERIDYGVGIFSGEKLVGTGFLCGEIIQGVAILPEYQGEGISAKIVTNILKRAIYSGKEHLFLFTKPQKAFLFENLGFKKIVDAKPYASLLEWGKPGIRDFKAYLQSVSVGKPENSACIVINANPFTLGHRYLVEKASSESPWLYVLVVEENRSVIPFDVRFQLVKEGLRDLGNITVIRSGKYVISSATFPSYFTKNEELSKAHANLDLTVFCKHIVPSLKVVKRYVGSEPYCKVTSTYNNCMKKILPRAGVKVEEIPRISAIGDYISASRVRDLICKGKLEQTKELLPITTYSFFKTAKGKKIINQMCKENKKEVIKNEHI